MVSFSFRHGQDINPSGHYDFGGLQEGGEDTCKLRRCRFPDSSVAGVGGRPRLPVNFVLEAALGSCCLTGLAGAEADLVVGSWICFGERDSGVEAAEFFRSRLKVFLETSLFAQTHQSEDRASIERLVTIDTVNLEAPSSRFHKRKIDADVVIAAMNPARSRLSVNSVYCSCTRVEKPRRTP